MRERLVTKICIVKNWKSVIKWQSPSIFSTKKNIDFKVKDEFVVRK